MKLFGEKHSIYEIANYFLTKDSMTAGKLYRLTYYAEAWCNALYGHSLINDEFEAWAQRPVAPRLFDKYENHSWEPIPKIEDTKFPHTQALDLLESVWLTYGDKTANELEVLSRSEFPWKIAREGIPEAVPSHNKISKANMAKYYRSIYSGD